MIQISIMLQDAIWKLENLVQKDKLSGVMRDLREFAHQAGGSRLHVHFHLPDKFRRFGVVVLSQKMPFRGS
jgi:hypothetical protein